MLEPHSDDFLIGVIQLLVSLLLNKLDPEVVLPFDHSPAGGLNKSVANVHKGNFLFVLFLPTENEMVSEFEVVSVVVLFFGGGTNQKVGLEFGWARLRHRFFVQAF